MIEIRKATTLKKIPQSCLNCKFGIKTGTYSERYCELLRYFVGDVNFHCDMDKKTKRSKKCPLVEVK